MQLNLMDYNNTTKKVKMVRAYTSTAKDTQQDKPNKKTKGGQKLTWHQFITRELNTIGIDLQKAIKLSKDRHTTK